MMILQLCETNTTLFIRLHFSFFWYIRIIRRFSVCFFFFFIFILYRIALYRSKAPWFDHRAMFDTCMAVWTFCICFLCPSKPIAFRTNNNVFFIILAVKIVFSLILFVISRSWIRIQTSTFIYFFINRDKTARSIFAYCNSNISFWCIFDVLRSSSSAF